MGHAHSDGIDQLSIKKPRHFVYLEIEIKTDRIQNLGNATSFEERSPEPDPGTCFKKKGFLGCCRKVVVIWADLKSEKAFGFVTFDL